MDNEGRLTAYKMAHLATTGVLEDWRVRAAQAQAMVAICEAELIRYQDAIDALEEKEG